LGEQQVNNEVKSQWEKTGDLQKEAEDASKQETEQTQQLME